MQDEKSGYQNWCRGKKVTPKGGEPVISLQKKIRQFLKEIGRRHAGKKIAIVTHGGPVKTFLYEALKLPFRSFWSFRIEPASMTILGIGRHFAQAFCINDRAHLPHHLTVRPEYVGR
jgi:broad specificity phosphatase PhoE